MARGLRRYRCKGCGRTFNALTRSPLSGLHGQGTLAVVRGVAGEGGDGEGLGGALRRAVSTAFRWRHRFQRQRRRGLRFGGAQGDRGNETYVLESRKGARGLGRKARRRGGKAKKRGLSREQVPVLMAADRSGTTVKGRCGGAHGCISRPGGREGRPAGLRRWRELPTLRRRARGEPRSTQPLDGGTGSGRSACADGEQPPQPVEGLPAPPSRRSPPLSGQLPLVLVRPRYCSMTLRNGNCLAAPLQTLQKSMVRCSRSARPSRSP